MTKTNNASPGSDLTLLQQTPSPTVSLSGFPGVDDHYTISPVSPFDAINKNMSSLELWRESIGAHLHVHDLMLRVFSWKQDPGLRAFVAAHAAVSRQREQYATRLSASFPMLMPQ